MDYLRADRFIGVKGLKPGDLSIAIQGIYTIRHEDPISEAVARHVNLRSNTVMYQTIETAKNHKDQPKVWKVAEKEFKESMLTSVREEPAQLMIQIGPHPTTESQICRGIGCSRG